MTHRLTTDCAKNYCSRTLIVQVILENVVTCFGTQTHPILCPKTAKRPRPRLWKTSSETSRDQVSRLENYNCG